MRPETTYRLVVPCRRYSHVLGFVAHINAGGIGMYHFQAEFLALGVPDQRRHDDCDATTVADGNLASDLRNYKVQHGVLVLSVGLDVQRALTTTNQA